MKKTILIVITGIVFMTIALVSEPAPAASQRDVITDAGPVCSGLSANVAPLDAACTLLFKTNGSQEIDSSCNSPFDNIDHHVLVYRLRNCDRNEEALLRNASSVVLAIDDWLTRGKIQQKQAAAGYACSYADKYDLLIGAGKLSDGGADLASDAQNIAAALGFACP